LIINYLLILLVH